MKKSTKAADWTRSNLQKLGPVAGTGTAVEDR
jgi:hypothetical protein